MQFGGPVKGLMEESDANEEKTGKVETRDVNPIKNRRKTVSKKLGGGLTLEERTQLVDLKD